MGWDQKTMCATKPPECLVKIDPPWLVVTPKGYFNDLMGKQLNDQIGKSPPAGEKALMFDFSDCPVVNSTGLAAMLDACETFQEEFHLNIGFCKLSNLLLEAFQIAGMNQVGTMFATVEEAKVFFGS